MVLTEEEKKEMKREASKKFYLKNKNNICEKRKDYRKQNKQKIKEKQKQYRIKNKEKIKKYSKEYRIKNKEKINEHMKEYSKEYRIKNRELLKQKYKEYSKTPQGIKSNRISDWKRYGMICEDFESMYEIYIHTHNCEWCNCEFTKNNFRCLDHDHLTGEIRGILCNSCNVKDVLK